ncbi:MAG: hypothetical protein IT438_01030 [Phycisphaerales bacterium]|nr:hypothetical protein [Phycisphaerales bacterium]
MSHDPLHPETPHHAHSHETAPMHDSVDAWHDHAADEKPQQAHSEVGNATMITGVGLALFMVIVFSVVAVYAYYTWFVSQRLSEQEVAFGLSPHSPAAVARQYKRDALQRLEAGGEVRIQATETLPALNYKLIKIDDAMKAVAETYTSPRRAAADVPAEPRN